MTEKNDTPPTYRHRQGIRIHRSRTLSPADVTIHEGIPVTTPVRTLRDLRSRLPHKQLLAVLTRAERRGLDTGELGSGTDPNRTRLEQRFLALCRRHGMRLPQCQVIIGPHTVDFMWPDKDLIVEVDGWQTHGTREAFESDRARDAWLTSQGHRVIRFTWRQLHEDATTVVTTSIAILNPPSRQAA
jgi:very-short-patch-repair endonuclease